MNLVRSIGNRRSVRSALVALASLPVPALVASHAAGQDADPAQQRLENSPRHHEWVDVKTASGRTVRTWVVYPEVDHPVAAVVVIHENRGLNDWARSVADRLAEAGYVALAPDLLSGTGPDGGGTSSYGSSDDARNAIYRLPAEQVMTDVAAAVDHAREMSVTTGAVSVAGFCWGGGQAFRYATRDPGIAAAFVFYGSPVTDEASLKKIAAPVYGFYGGNDFRITGSVAGVEETMKTLGKTYEFVVYEGAGHAFMRLGELADANKANRMAEEQAWKRWLGLLKKLDQPAAGQKNSEGRGETP